MLDTKKFGKSYTKITMHKTCSNWKITHKPVGVAASLLFIYLLVSMALLMIGRQPTNAQESIIAQRENQLINLLRLDYLALPLYYPVFFTVLKRLNNFLALVTSLSGLFGAIIFLTMPSNFSQAILSGEFPFARFNVQETLFQVAN